MNTPDNIDITQTAKWKRYEDFCRKHDSENRSSLMIEPMERHHIWPRSIRPDLADFGEHPNNCALLTRPQHAIAHLMLLQSMYGVRGYSFETKKAMRAAKMMLDFAESSDGEFVSWAISVAGSMEQAIARARSYDQEAHNAEKAGMTLDEWRIAKAKRMKDSHRRYYTANKARMLATQAEYVRRHLDQTRRTKKKYQDLHREEINAKNRAKYAEDIDTSRAKSASKYIKYRSSRKAYRDAHRDQNIEYQKRYRELHAEEKRARDAEYRMKNAERISAWKKEHYKKHMEEIRARHKAYRDAHKEEINRARREKYASRRSSK